ncbi:peroxide stress protein YaaA [Mycetocola manganoxydans]|uniref:Peroxide stress protein YaaA n=1 Tax=Mycetocola manganoxydans TaxID=699879 RepID=A0A3L7A181_9MICO|nr:peroxide stress protein YaaA [Mycetocola manganoxydans]RLP73760.1 peroxide stress protein YaaA [Mycetocola manganoxydans]GHD43212.1 peroxide stress protein YaaA [Mycetocola manganoxydans]
MLVLLPPSETKRAGGTGRSLSLEDLRFPSLTDARRALADDVVALSEDADAAIAALKLGPKQHGEVDTNRELWQSPTLPALDRYTGVLFDALDAASLSPGARAFAGEHLVIHAALFGPVGALDPIPAYRLSHDSRVPGRPLKRHWRSAVEQTLAAETGLVLDLRSEAYVALGPAPEGTHFLRVLTESPGGVRRALNHFNKKAKGEFTRALIESETNFTTTDQLLDWASDVGIRIERQPDSTDLALLV